MRLSGLRVERQGGQVRASADLVWEDCARVPARLFFEVDEERGEGMIANPHAFLLAAAVPALRFGERRVAIDAPACPVFLEGLVSALAIIAAWHYEGGRQPPVIEVASRQTQLAPGRAGRAGSFFSGGIDSYATVRLNMLAYPEGHPYRIREGVLAFGLEQDDPRKFRHVATVLADAAAELDLTLTTVSTNIYLLYRDEDARDRFRFWYLMYEGSALAAIAHSLTHRFSSMSISGTISPRMLVPFGSHPMLDPSFSSSDLRIHHAGAGLTRLEKTDLIASWGGVDPRHLRVCNQYKRYEDAVLNCGECGKCLMTKLAFAALGRHEALAAFANPELSVPLLRRRVRLEDPHDLDVYSELVEPLAARGYAGVARWLARMVRMYRWFGPDLGWRRLPERLTQATMRRLGVGPAGARPTKLTSRA